MAGVGAAGTVMFIVMSLTQVLGVGAVALISQAVGRRDRDDANLVFNQSIVLAVLCAVATIVGGYAAAAPYVSAITADLAARDVETASEQGFALLGVAAQDLRRDRRRARFSPA